MSQPVFPHGVDNLVMDNQTAFNRVCEHLLLKQKAPSLKVRKGELGSRCAYRGEDGRSCAVGCLLSDEVAAKLDELDDAGWSQICRAASAGDYNLDEDELAACKAAAAELDGVSDSLLNRLQSAHDQYSDPSLWLLEPWLDSVRRELRLIAGDYALHKPDYL